MNWCPCSVAVFVHGWNAVADVEFYMAGVWKCSLQELLVSCITHSQLYMVLIDLPFEWSTGSRRVAMSRLSS